MNLKKLEAFIMVVEKNSFSEAAASLKSSQPTVSLKVKSLEEDMGFELIDRGVSGIRPTPAGMLVYAAAKEIAQRWRELEDELSVFQGTLTGTLTIGASTIPGTYLLPGWIKKFHGLYPNVEVKIEIGDSRKILDKLHSHSVDLAITGLQQDAKQLTSKPIAVDSLVLIAPKQHPLVHAANPDFTQIKQYDFVMREEGSGTRKMMEEFLSAKGFSVAELKTAVSIGSTEAVIAAVEAGLGISFISKLAALPAAKAERIKIIDQFEPYKRDFYLAAHVDYENRPLIKPFFDMVVKE